MQSSERPESFPSSSALLAAAIASIALSVVAATAIGVTPTTEQTGPELVAWLGEHAAGVRWAALAITLNTPLLGFLFASLRQLLPGWTRDMFFLGASTIVITTPVQAWTWAGLAVHADPDLLDPAVARTVLDVALFWGPMLTGATITMMAPVTWLALTGRAPLPRWLGVLGLVAIVEQAIEMVTIFGREGFLAPGGAMNLQLGAGIVAVWMMAFAIWAALRARTA